MSKSRIRYGGGEVRTDAGLCVRDECQHTTREGEGGEGDGRFLHMTRSELCLDAICAVLWVSRVSAWVSSGTRSERVTDLEALGD